MDLRDAVVVVTGASGGIGAATVAELSRRGASAVCVGRDERTLAELTASHGGSFVAVDVTDAAAADRIVAHALDRHQRLDGIVAAAGIGWKGEVADMPPATVSALVDVNLLAPVLLARAALPELRRRHGAFVAVTSVAGMLVVPGETVYSATKAALEAFVDGLREEESPHGVTVASVAPGAVATAFFARRGSPYDRRFPRPVAAERVAADICAALEGDRRRILVPRWMALPARLRAAAPRTYRRLARRLG